eukprot:2929799-Pyramimonas_sp.AAC.1
MRAQRLGPPVELSRVTKRVNAVPVPMGAVGACENSHWGLRWGSPWGHSTCEQCGEIRAVDACERSHWGPCP